MNKEIIKFDKPKIKKYVIYPNIQLTVVFWTLNALNDFKENVGLQEVF